MKAPADGGGEVRVERGGEAVVRVLARRAVPAADVYRLPSVLRIQGFTFSDGTGIFCSQELNAKSGYVPSFRQDPGNLNSRAVS